MMLMLSMNTSSSILVTRTALLLRTLPIVSCILTLTQPTPLLAHSQTVSSSTIPLLSRRLVVADMTKTPYAWAHAFLTLFPPSYHFCNGRWRWSILHGIIRWHRIREAKLDFKNVCQFRLWRSGRRAVAHVPRSNLRHTITESSVMHIASRVTPSNLLALIPTLSLMTSVKHPTTLP